MTLTPSLLEVLSHAPVPSLAVLCTEGADAVSFLHGQVTNDLQGLTTDNARLAAYCSAKGRVEATLVIWRDDTPDGPRLWLLTSTSVADALLKRLRMFVLRAKVTITRTDHLVEGVWSSMPIAELPATPWQRLTLPDGTTWIAALPCAESQHRWWRISAPGQSVLPGTPQSAQVWDWQEVAAGLPWITSTTQGQFTPHALNFDRIDGISFTKGCYPGQEVVARSHYLGKVKRRTVLLEPALGETALAEVNQAQADVHVAEDTGEPVGRTIAVARHDDGRWAALVEARTDALEDVELRWGNAHGPVSVLRPLPYDG